MSLGRTLRAGSALLLIGAAFGVAANTQVFRCVNAQGEVVFSDTGCGSTTDQQQKVEVVQSSGGLSQIKGNGLTSQETSELTKIKAAQAAQQSGAQGGGSSPSKSGSSSAPSPTPIHSSY